MEPHIQKRNGSGEQKVVLVVEDDPDLLHTLQDLLEWEGYNVYPASHGKQALEFLTAAGGIQPDLVVLDLMMPIVSGWEVLRQMRHQDSLCTVPVIVITAALKEKPEGATAVITKPFDLEDLFRAIESSAKAAASRPS